MFTSLGNSIPRNGLVGEWLLDGNALDTSGNGYNGTNTNGVYVKTYRGYQNQCWQGNGSNATLNSSTGLGISITSFSINLWINTNSIPTGTTERRAIALLNSSSQNLFYFQLYQSKYYAIAGVGGANGILNPSSPTPTSGTWEMISLTNTGTVFKMYRNGVEIATGGSGTFTGTLDKITISGANYWDGFLQGVRIYNRTLSQDEIQLLYLEGQKLLGPTNIAKYPNLLSGLVGYWDFKGTAHNLVDGVAGTVTGATLTTDRFGNSNSAYSFNKSSGGQDIKLATNFGLPYANSNRSFHIKFKLNSLPSGVYPSNLFIVLAHQIVSGGSRMFWRFAVDWTGSQYRLYFYSRGNYVFSPVIGQYYNLTVSTSSGGVNNIYLDGSLIISNSNTDTASRTSEPDLFYLGGANLSGGTPSIEGMDGVIDLCYVFNRGISADEVKLLYNLTSQDYIYPTPSYDLSSLRDGLVLDLNEQGQDLSGNGNNGTLVNSPTVVRQGKAKGLSYNGSNQYVSVTDFEYNIETSFTYNAWIKVIDYTDFNGIIEQDSTTSRGVLFRTDITTGKLNLIRLNSGGTVLTNLLSPNAIGTGTWLMVTATFNNTIGSKIFINGIQVASDSIFTNTNNATTPIIIGARENGTNNFMYGNIISPRIRNRALSSKEIQQLYYSQKGNFIY